MPSYILRPDSDIRTDWTPLGGGTSYTEINEAAPDDAASYVSESTPFNSRDRYGLTNIPALATGEVITNVRVTVRARTTGATGLLCGVRVNGDFYRTQHTLTGSWTDYVDDYAFNPYSHQRWIEADMNALEVFLEDGAGAGTQYVTQIFVTVTTELRSTGEPSGYDFNQTLRLSNNSASQLDAGYSVLVDLSGDDAAEIFDNSDGVNGDDVRIAYDDGGGSWRELDREIETYSAGSVQIWLKTQTNIAGSDSDNNYRIYYGHASPGTPPTQKQRIFSSAVQGTDGEYLADTGDKLYVICLGHFIATDTVDGDNWQAQGVALANGNFLAAICLPDDGDSWTTAGDGPTLNVKIRKKNGNTLYLWICGHGVDTNGDSYFLGFEDTYGAFEDPTTDGTDMEWEKSDQSDVSGAGTVGANLCAREDGVQANLFLITENNGWTPDDSTPDPQGNTDQRSEESYWRPLQDAEPSMDFAPTAVAYGIAI